MQKKPTSAQIAERFIYLLSVVLVPSIPLFFLYSQNAAQGLLFKYFLIMGGALALISLVLYLLISKLFLRRRRAMIIITLFWAAFWFFKPLGKIIARGNVGFSQIKITVYLLILVLIIAFILRFIKMNRLVANTIAVLLCLMFVYNFIPSALAVFAGERQRVKNEKTGELPYKIKTEFNVDPNLPKPNVYWLHMDGMVGFDAVERYFNDPQTELKNDLAKRGFVINKSARLEAGYTQAAVPAMTSPVFFDSYLKNEFIIAAQLTRGQRENFINININRKGISFDMDIYPKIEILKAFSNAGYINIANKYDPKDITFSENIDILINDYNVTTGLDIKRKADNMFNILFEFKELITDASALIIIKSKTDEIFEKKRPIANTQALPAYQETVENVTGYPGYDKAMAYMIRMMKYATLIPTPHFIYFFNGTMHAGFFESVIGEVTYKEPVGWTFGIDEYGNYYKEPLDDPLDVHLYLPQHKYAVKQMIAQIDTVLENDPNAVIILQADHGIHCYGYNNFPFDFEAMSARGYNLEDQLNLNLSVMSAVRIPPQYGKLTQPLDPLDIARYLVNNFVGKGNYEYLYYKESTE